MKPGHSTFSSQPGPAQCTRLSNLFYFFSPVLEGWSGRFPTCARPTRGVLDCALREHRESPGLHPFLFPSVGGSGQGCPRLRASEDIHVPSKLVRYLSRDGGWLIFHCARPTRGVCDRALREQRRSSGSIPSSVLRAKRAP